MQLVHDQEQNVELEVVVELGSGQAPSAELEARVVRSVRSQLEQQNSEFLHDAPAERRTPRVRLLPLGEPEYFPIGVKHRSTR